MEKMSRNKRCRIIPERLSNARNNKDMTQRELAHQLETYMGGDQTVNAATISMAETGRRPISTKYNTAIAEVLGVSEAYLTGKSSTPWGEENSSTIINRERTLISYDNLYYYDQQPIYVEFLKIEHEPAWGIYSQKDRRIYFPNYYYSIFPESQNDIKLYIIAPEYAAQFHRFEKKCLTRQQMMNCDSIFIIMNSTDPAIRARYEGWYRHNENKTNLINSFGLTLPYEGLNISYMAYNERIVNGETKNSKPIIAEVLG